ncbi:MAG: hypothetical protein ACKVT0_04930 [Planctomycetaceae bacterium]
MKLSPSSLTDAEYVERVRKGIEQWDRWKWFFSSASIFVVITLGWSLHMGIQKMLGLALRANVPNVWDGIILGGAIGITVGFIIENLLSNMLLPLFEGQRTERMLVQYYDAVHGKAGETQKSNAELF